MFIGTAAHCRPTITILLPSASTSFYAACQDMD